jgi:hypothetical protein
LNAVGALAIVRRVTLFDGDELGSGGPNSSPQTVRSARFADANANVSKWRLLMVRCCRLLVRQVGSQVVAAVEVVQHHDNEGVSHG